MGVIDIYERQQWGIVDEYLFFSHAVTEDIIAIEHVLGAYVHNEVCFAIKQQNRYYFC